MYKLRLAKKGEELIAHELGNKGRKIMQSRENPQWDTGYPQVFILMEDIKLSRLYFVYDEDDPLNIIGMCVLQKEKDEEYEAETFWKLKGPYICCHRIVSLRKGVGKFILNEAIQLAKNENKIVRIDTHPKNKAMQNLVKSLGFKECGRFFQAGYIDGLFAIAYEMLP